ncbi:MAG: 3-hydroxyacyl-CoA dehydrogenase NAD-binding domain-containing protein, partial [Candidatus Neomarinimicrobiota bacterium]
MEILVFGAGYVGLSNAVMLASKNNVKVIDINKNKIEKLQKRISPISDDLIEKDIKNKRLKISFTTKKDFDLKKFKIAIIATPTDFNPKKKSFDTKSIEDALNTLKKGGYKNLAVIRSTIPIGFT